MRPVVLLASGALIAAAAVLSSAGSNRAKRTAAPNSGQATSVSTESASKPPELRLDTMQRVGNHFEATTGDGQRATLTLDPVLQQTADQLLVESRAPRGAIVAMTPDGRILALSGRRSASPTGSRSGTFDWRLATEVWAPAASVFKLVTASALVAGGIDPDQKIRYHGGLRSITESNLRDSRRDNSSESLTYAIAHSNNAIVGKLAYLHLEPTELTALALRLMTPVRSTFSGSLGEFSLPREKNLEFAQAAAGFNGSRLSVLGGALLAATFAGEGNQPRPKLIDASETTFDKEAPRRVLAPQVARAVGRMMVATCEFGSAAKSFRRRQKHRMDVAGKTGTLTTRTPFYMEHSWFVGYAPADQPQIVVAVLLSNPESWHLRGHEAARRLIDKAIGERAITSVAGRAMKRNR